MKINMIRYLKQYSNTFKYRKYPCKKCLVKATCNDLARDCQYKEDHFKYDRAKENVKDELSEWFFIVSFFGGMAFVVLTFILGIWKWVEIGWAYF